MKEETLGEAVYEFLQACFMGNDKPKSVENWQLLLERLDGGGDLSAADVARWDDQTRAQLYSVLSVALIKLTLRRDADVPGRMPGCRPDLLTESAVEALVGLIKACGAKPPF
ncbi:protein of unknown function [Stenotrophomonas maltophilia]|nr:protein of unknown function [Stenotrophomonas maltophilia]